jgi:hypothetical protein
MSGVSASETGLTTRWVNETDWLSLVAGTDRGPPPGWKAEQVLAGIARGCVSQDFREGDELIAGVLIEAAGEQATVVSTVRLYAAH